MVTDVLVVAGSLGFVAFWLGWAACGIRNRVILNRKLSQVDAILDQGSRAVAETDRLNREISASEARVAELAYEADRIVKRLQRPAR